MMITNKINTFLFLIATTMAMLVYPPKPSVAQAPLDTFQPCLFPPQDSKEVAKKTSEKYYLVGILPTVDEGVKLSLWKYKKGPGWALYISTKNPPKSCPAAFSNVDFELRLDNKTNPELKPDGENH